MASLKDNFFDIETRSFLGFYLACKYRFKYYSQRQIKNYQAQRVKDTDFLCL